MKRILVEIPSKGRPYVIGKKTLSWLPKVKFPEGVDWKVFVEPQEAMYYRQVVPKEHLVIIDQNDGGFGYVTDFMRRYATEHGYYYEFKIDDDVTGFIDERCKAAHRIEVFEKLLVDLPQAFEDHPEVGLIRFISGNSFYFEKGKQKKFIYRNIGGWNTFMVRNDLNVTNPEYHVYSDTALHLHLWKGGYETMAYGLAAVNVEVYTNPGGCQMRDRRKDSEDAVACLEKEFPGVKLVDAKNTVGYDIDTGIHGRKKEAL